MTVLILDPVFEQIIKDDREKHGLDRWDEVWDGVLVVPPAPDNEQRRLVLEFAIAFVEATDRGRGDQVLPGANVSDREEGWTENYRIPDVLVRLAGGRAKDCGTHWVGGPDVAVEIPSPGEDPRQKLDFYSKVGTREVLIVEREPWAIELYQLVGGMLQPAGRSDLSNPAILASGVLPLTFQLRDESPRPTILVSHTATGQTWVV
ncbi:MAG: hypothetical protein JWO38_532 [Gemmataceae bacterium]|nr:hypothetical protein [Gemmataceae bacterium]